MASNVNRFFTLDFRTGTEINDFAIGMQLAARKGFAVNIYTTYLLSRKDVCPYIGGAFGFHWVSHPGFDDDDDINCDGFEFTANMGVRLFHTYNFQVLFNFAYAVTFNDFDDKAIIFTIGLLR